MGTGRRLKIYFALIFLLSIILGINCFQDQVEHEMAQFEVVDYCYSDSCNIYMMKFYEGDYAFRFSLSGRCRNLNKVDYLKIYKFFLSQSITFSDVDTNQKIRIEYYKEMKTDKSFDKNLFTITRDWCDCEVRVRRKWSEGLEFEIISKL